MLKAGILDLTNSERIEETFVSSNLLHSGRSTAEFIPWPKVRTGANFEFNHVPSQGSGSRTPENARELIGSPHKREKHISWPSCGVGAEHIRECRERPTQENRPASPSSPAEQLLHRPSEPPGETLTLNLPDSSVMSLVGELPPVELHCLLSLKSFRLLAQWSEPLLSGSLWTTGFRCSLASKEAENDDKQSQ